MMIFHLAVASSETSRPRRRWRALVLAVGLAPTLALPPVAAEVEVMPRLVVNGIWSDNIDLAADDPQQEFITQVIPGVAISAEGRRISGEIDYARENLYFRENSDRNTGFNLLRANGSTELLRDVLYLDASGSIRQQVIDPGGLLIIDNINPAARTDITTYTAGPTLRNRFGSAAVTEASYQRGEVRYSGTTQLADADITVVDLSITSGPGFRNMSWGALYQLDETDRGGGDVTAYESVESYLNLRVGPRLELQFLAGYVNDDVQAVQIFEDGSYFSAGFIWEPSPFWTLQGAYGTRNSEASITWTPSPRTLARIGYTNRSLGLDTGERWLAEFRRDFRRVGLTLSYAEDTTNQQLLDIAGASPPPLLSVGGTQVNPETIVFRTSNEDFLRRNLRVGIGINGVRNDFELNLTSERREFRVSGDTDRFSGADTVWRWRLSARTFTEVTGGVLNRRFEGDITDDTYWYGGLGLVRMLRPNIETAIRYRYVTAESGDVTLYRENRVVAGVVVVF